MAANVFSTVDRLVSRFKLVDNFITTVAARLFPQYEVKAEGCYGVGSYPCGSGWSTGYCLPTSDLRLATECFCCDHGGIYHTYVCGCDNCG